MTKHQPKNVSASVKARLINLARERDDDFSLLLIQYGMERLLYRLSMSGYADSFALKGALLLNYWADAPHRPTRDVDLLSFESFEMSRL